MHSLGDKLRARGLGEAIVGRIMRLNPDPKPFDILRGLHLAPTLHREALRADVLGKRDFIVKVGRDAWDRLPKHCVRKNGRRKYVTREAVLDKLWMLPDNHPARILNHEQR